MTVSIHSTSGWALVISLSQNMALPTVSRRQGGRAGRTDSFPLPDFVTHSPSLPAHLCLSLKLCFCEGCVSSSCPYTTCDFQPRSTVLRRSVCFSPVREGETSESHLPSSLPPSMSSVCMQPSPHRWSADTSCPERSSGCQFPPQSETICTQYFAHVPPNFSLLIFFPLFSL